MTLSVGKYGIMPMRYIENVLLPQRARPRHSEVRQFESDLAEQHSEKLIAAQSSVIFVTNVLPLYSDLCM